MIWKITIAIVFYICMEEKKPVLKRVLLFSTKHFTSIYLMSSLLKVFETDNKILLFRGLFAVFLGGGGGIYVLNQKKKEKVSFIFNIS